MRSVLLLVALLVCALGALADAPMTRLNIVVKKQSGAPVDRAAVVVRFVEGRSIEFEGTELSLPWTGSWTLPVWVACYGPMALAMTGRPAWYT